MSKTHIFINHIETCQVPQFVLDRSRYRDSVNNTVSQKIIIYDLGPCQPNVRTLVAEVELSSYSLCYLLAALVSKGHTNQTSLYFP